MGMLTAMWDGFVDRYRDTLEPVTLDAGSQLVSLAPRIGSYTPRALTPIHYDFRLDNMLFATSAGGRPLTVVDWQTVQLGLGPADVAYFLGNAFDAATRRSCERDLVQRYHSRLVGYGIDDYPFEECWDDYRRSSFASLMMAVFASMMVGRTDRGDTMFMAMANRSAQMAADLDAPSVIAAG
jgi:aminoglycoside phosphotransferase (APT) family kinase protein